MKVSFKLERGIKTLVVPFHITHISDMDGVTCAFLTNIAIDFNTEDVQCGAINMLPSCVDDVLIKDAHPVINSGRNVCILDPIVCPIGYTEKSKEFLMDYLNEFSELLELIQKDDANRSVVPVIIATDITVPSETTVQIKDILSRYSGFSWYFDHHGTNPECGTWVMSENFIHSKYTDAVVPVSANCISPKCTFEDFYQMFPDDEVLARIRNRFNESDVWGVNGPTMAHSSTWQYFLFMLAAGIIREVNLYSCEIDVLLRFVYRIDIADTYTFDDDSVDLPVKFDIPDFYACFMKSKVGFWDVYTEILREYRSNIQNFGKEDVVEIAPGEMTQTVYADRIFMSESSWVMTRKYIEKREKVFYKTLNDSRVLNIKDIWGFSQCHTVAVVVVTDDMDISYVGNQIMKSCGVDYVIFMYAENRMISVRTRKEKVNLQKLMKTFGGGGHPNAAGATLDKYTFLRLLTQYWDTPSDQNCRSLYKK